jgi:hypothetical protein
MVFMSAEDGRPFTRGLTRRSSYLAGITVNRVLSRDSDLS